MNLFRLFRTHKELLVNTERAMEALNTGLQAVQDVDVSRAQEIAAAAERRQKLNHVQLGLANLFNTPVEAPPIGIRSSPALPPVHSPRTRPDRSIYK